MYGGRSPYQLSDELLLLLDVLVVGVEALGAFVVEAEGFARLKLDTPLPVTRPATSPINV